VLQISKGSPSYSLRITYKLAVRQTRASAIELDLADIKIRLEDLGCVTPRREVCNGICLVRDWVPELDALGHLSLPDARIGIIARVQATGRRMVISQHYHTRVEREVLFRDLLAP